MLIYKTIDEQNEFVVSVLKKNEELMKILDFVDSLKLPNYYIAAGVVFQTIWNYLDCKPLNYGVDDIDVIYYNNEDISLDADLKYYDVIKKYIDSLGYSFEVDVSNEARMHLWREEKQKIKIAPFKSSEDAIRRWISTVHAIGVTKVDGELRVYAPYGFNDIFTRTVRPIKQEDISKEVYVKKAKSWSKRFNNLNIIEW